MPTGIVAPLSTLGGWFAEPTAATWDEAFCHRNLVVCLQMSTLSPSSAELPEDDECLLDGVRRILWRHFLLPLFAYLF